MLTIWLLHNLVEASFDLFRYLLLGDQLKPWELHPLVSYTSCLWSYDCEINAVIVMIAHKKLEYY